MGHQNIRFYVARAMEGLRELLARGGLRVKPANDEIEAWPVTHHLRLMLENRAGTPLHLRGGIVAIEAKTLRAAFTLFHSATGEISATFLIDLEARKKGSKTKAAWPDAFVSAVSLHPLPGLCQPRGLTATSPFLIGLGEADALGMIETGNGIIPDEACDREERLRPENIIALLSDSTRSLTNEFHRAAESLSGAPARIGSAGVECRLRYYHRPRAGDRYVVRGGLSALSERSRKTLYWMLDRTTRTPIAELEAVELLLDLDRRRSFPLEERALASLGRLLVSAKQPIIPNQQGTDL